VIGLMVFTCAHANPNYDQEQERKEDEASADTVLRETNVAFYVANGGYKQSDGIVMNAIGNIGPDTTRSILKKLDGIRVWLDVEQKQGEKKNNDCWLLCNGSKNWKNAAVDMQKIQNQWRKSIVSTKDSSEAFKKWGRNSIDGIKTNCWGYKCSDSKERNRIYLDMKNRLQAILDDESFTDITGAPTELDSNRGDRDAWLEQHELNTYGDSLNTMYMGGSPLFDESTGEMTSLDDYLNAKFPDNTWSVSSDESEE